MKLSEYIKKFGDKQVDADKLSEFIIENKVFVPKENEKFWYISIFGNVCSLVCDKREVENILKIQQVYRTRAEAEFARDKAIFLEFMRKEFLRNSDEIDWEDDNQTKCDIYYNHAYKLITIHTVKIFSKKRFFYNKQKIG